MGQSTNAKNGRKYDIINILIIPDNTTITYYFDITDFFGKL